MIYSNKFPHGVDWAFELMSSRYGGTGGSFRMTLKLKLESILKRMIKLKIDYFRTYKVSFTVKNKIGGFLYDMSNTGIPLPVYVRDRDLHMARDAQASSPAVS